MSSVLAVKERLSGRVADLAGKVDEAADLAALVAAKELPQRSPSAFVLKLGFNGGSAEAATGLFIQGAEEVIGVVLVVRAIDDAKARRALAAIDTLEDQALEAICGWVPAGAIGVFRCLRGRLVSVASGLVIYQLDFALPTQLRINPT